MMPRPAGMPRVLLVAPAAGNLPFVEKEIQRVANALHPRLLFGDVTLEKLLDEMQRSYYDIFWFAGHSDGDGLVLSDGTVAAARVVQLLRKQKPDLVFLNTCASLALAMDIQQQVGSYVIGTVLPLPDDEAFVTGSALATALAEGMSIEDAFAVSRPGSNRQYVLLGHVEHGNEAPDTADDEAEELRMIRFLNQWGQRLEERIEQSERRMDEKMERLRREMGERFDGLDDRYHTSLTGRRMVAWLAAFVLFLVGVVVMTSHELQQFLELRSWVAAIGAIFLIALSVPLFVYGIGFRWSERTLLRFL